MSVLFYANKMFRLSSRSHSGVDAIFLLPGKKDENCSDAIFKHDAWLTHAEKTLFTVADRLICRKKDHHDVAGA